MINIPTQILDNIETYEYDYALLLTDLHIYDLMEMPYQEIEDVLDRLAASSATLMGIVVFHEDKRHYRMRYTDSIGSIYLTHISNWNIFETDDFLFYTLPRVVEWLRKNRVCPHIVVDLTIEP